MAIPPKTFKNKTWCVMKFDDKEKTKIKFKEEMLEMFF